MADLVCPKCGAELLTWSQIHKRRHDTGIEAIVGLLNENSYCLADPKEHPFFCEQHKKIHMERCQHAYSAVEYAFLGNCPKCGDEIANAANFRDWLYEDDYYDY
jgi:predicted RNA-binding Zn-ribbon protein involved in translation (DUF1610 family)